MFHNKGEEYQVFTFLSHRNDNSEILFELQCIMGSSVVWILDILLCRSGIKIFRKTLYLWMFCMMLVTARMRMFVPVWAWARRSVHVLAVNVLDVSHRGRPFVWWGRGLVELEWVVNYLLEREWVVVQLLEREWAIMHLLEREWAYKYLVEWEWASTYRLERECKYSLECE